MSSPQPAVRRTAWPRAVLFGMAGALVVGIVVLAFVWPAATATARNLPVGIAGPADQVQALESAVAKQSTNPFDLVAVDSRADAVRRIRDRELYGAILLGDSPEVLTSSAGSSVANQALRGVAAQLQTQITAKVEAGLIAKLQQAGQAVAGLQQQIGVLRKALQSGNGGVPAAPQAGAPSRGSAAPVAPPEVAVTDVVALTSHDPNGAGLAGASFPLVLGGMLGGVLVSLLVVGRARRILALLVYGAAAGAAVTFVLQTWLQVLQRDWLTNAAAFGLAMTATAAVVVGFHSLLGQPGIAVGAMLSLLIGNPISGATLPYQFIAGPWGVVGQYFVPGAASSLVRSLSYFPDTDVRMQWLVLGAWTVGGLLLTLLGRSAPHRRVGLLSRRPPDGQSRLPRCTAVGTAA